MHEIAARAVFEQARHDVGATCHANGGGIVVSVEDQALLTQPVNMRCLDIRVAVASQGVVSLIVSEKKDDVGPLLPCFKPGEVRRYQMEATRT